MIIPNLYRAGQNQLHDKTNRSGNCMGKFQAGFHALTRVLISFDNLIARTSELPENFTPLSLDQLLRRTTNLRTLRLRPVFDLMITSDDNNIPWHRADDDTAAICHVADRMQLELIPVLRDIGLVDTADIVNAVE